LTGANTTDVTLFVASYVVQRRVVFGGGRKR
jgi:hypothetical protein